MSKSNYRHFNFETDSVVTTNAAGLYDSVPYHEAVRIYGKSHVDGLKQKALTTNQKENDNEKE